MKINKDKLLNLILVIIPFACIFIAWQIGSRFTNEFILPSIGQTLSGLVEVLGQKTFYSALFDTLLRSLFAFATSFFIAFILAFLSKISKKADVMITPVISVIRALPTIAVVLLILLWVDDDNIAPIIVTSLVVLPTTYSGLRDAFYSVDDEMIKALRLFNVSTPNLLAKVYIPQILPSTLLAIGGGFSLNLKLMVAAEVIVATPNSIGSLLNYLKNYQVMSKMIAIVLVAVLIGISVEAIFKVLSKKVGKWQ